MMMVRKIVVVVVMMLIQIIMVTATMMMSPFKGYSIPEFISEFPLISPLSPIND